jgi:DNA-binding SARP family transcriptional activator
MPDIDSLRREGDSNDPVNIVGQMARTDRSLRLRLLGGFELWTSAGLVPLAWDAQRLLALLAIRDRPLLRAKVSGVLSPDVNDARASYVLRAALWKVRRADRDLVASVGTHLGLGSTVVVDVVRMIRRVRRLVDDPVEVGGTAADLTLLADDLLPDWDEDWVIIERERLRQLRLHALEGLCELLSHADRHAEAIQAGLAAVAAEPLRESAHRVLIKAHLAERNVSEAWRQREAYRALLGEALGIEPSAEFDRLLAVPP